MTLATLLTEIISKMRILKGKTVLPCANYLSKCILRLPLGQNLAVLVKITAKSGVFPCDLGEIVA